MNYIVKKVFYLVLFIFVVVTNVYSKKIVNIPEASGICFIDKTKSIVVVNDEGWIYKLTTNGKIVQKKYLG
ncbi:MAG: hypothetical protein U9N59_05830, partial [Campylobacterota bacterium]|nr:hypothetical protein [Campylobacterota bacterium]